jgi:site-specific DNA-adenine methylase
MIETPFNYTGSKYKLLDQILPHFNYNKSNFVDVFCGGGSVYTNVLDKYEKIIINDIISDLIGIHCGLMVDDNIIELTKGLCPGKENPEG